MEIFNEAIKIQGRELVGNNGKSVMLFDFLRQQLDSARVQGVSKVVSLREKFNKSIKAEEAEAKVGDKEKVDLNTEEMDLLIKLIDNNPFGERVIVVAPVLWTLLAIQDKEIQDKDVKEAEKDGKEK